jgi:hypothetical protein
MGGPGDPLEWYRQAEQLLPFSHHYYGPVYFVAIRVLRDVVGWDWFTVGKMTSWLSAIAVLVGSYLLFAKVLGKRTRWIAVALVAANPVFITESYSAYALVFGAMWMLMALTLTVHVAERPPVQWLPAGVLFGIAYLARFQSLGFLLGAALGTLTMGSGDLRRRTTRVAALMTGAATVILLWSGFLIWKQGFVPANYNFVHLTPALDEFQTFCEVDNLVTRYGSMIGVLTADWTVAPRLAYYAAKQALKFPFDIGFRLTFLAVGWFIPGYIALVSKRDGRHASWLGAFTVGLILTGIGSRGWTHYYVVFIPFVILVVTYFVELVARSQSPTIARVSLCVIVASTLVWSPGMVRWGFGERNWPELTVARKYIESRRDAATVVSTTAASFAYGSTVPFVDHDKIMCWEEPDRLVARLREHRVTHFIVTERHTVYSFPDLAYLLEDPIPRPLDGLKREMLIVRPRRLAIFRVLPEQKVSLTPSR